MACIKARGAKYGGIIQATINAESRPIWRYAKGRGPFSASRVIRRSCSYGYTSRPLALPDEKNGLHQGAFG